MKITLINNMKIAFFSTKPYDKIWFKPLSEQYGMDIVFLSAKLEPDTISLAKGCNAVCAFVNDVINKHVIDGLYEIGVKCLLMRCAGYNNVNLEAAKGKISVFHVPSYSPEAVAEFAMALCLCLNRNVHRAYIRTRDFNMNINGLMGTDLCRKTAGIIGTGRIGQAMIRICKGFGMDVIAYDPYPNKSLDIKYVSLDELFKNSDLISLHCPLTDDTHYIIDKESLNKMKSGVIIVNTSRGKLINTEDLLDALMVKGKILGVGLDVYEEEENLFYEDKSNEIMEDEKFARLTTFRNVIISSHQGYFTKEAMEAIANVTLSNAQAFEKGLPFDNEVPS